MDGGPVAEQFAAVLIFDRPIDASVVERTLADRVPAVPRLRQRLVGTPVGCGRPIWVDDPAFGRRLAADAARSRLRVVRDLGRTWRQLRAAMTAGGGLRPVRAEPRSLVAPTGAHRRAAVVQTALAPLRATAHVRGGPEQREDLTRRHARPSPQPDPPPRGMASHVRDACSSTATVLRRRSHRQCRSARRLVPARTPAATAPRRRR